MYLSNWLDPEGAQRSKEQLSDNEKEADARNIYNKCFTNYYILSIDSNGDVIKCPQHQVVIAGLNIKKIPLRQLWLKEHLRFRQELADNASCFEECCTILKEQNRLIANHINSKR